MLTWHYVTSTEYFAASAETKTADKLYFLSDTHQIYRGTELFTEACSLVESWPTTPAVGRLYILSSSLEGRIYNGSAWQTVIQPVQASVDAADTSKPVSGKAVADYVSGAIADVTAGANKSFTNATYANQTITFTRTDGSEPVSVEIADLPVDLVYNADTGLLQLKDNDGAAIGTGINLDLERFVQSGSYDPETGKITLVFNDEQSVEIDASALVDVYEGAETTTATVTVSDDNKISAAVKVASASDNTLKVHADGGLYVAPTDLSAYATDAEVEAIRAALQGSIDANATAISNEETRAKAAEAQLTTDLGAEVTRAKAAEGELDTAVKAAQKAADDEATRAKAAEGELDTAVKAAQAAAEAAQTAADEEATRAKGVEAGLDTAVKAAQSAAEGAQAAAEAAQGTADQNAEDIAAIELVLEWKTTV